MRKYVTRAACKYRTKANQMYSDQPTMLVGTQVYPQEQEPIFIGILGPDGQPIYAVQERVRIGYCSQKLDLD